VWWCGGGVDDDGGCGVCFGMMILEGAMWEKKNPTAAASNYSYSYRYNYDYCDEAAITEQCEGAMKHV
jgi:hypothetical protein